MFALEKLQKAQQANRSFICLGLDLDPKKMPQDFGNSTRGMFEFARRIVEATADQVCAYKPNLAFYEALGADGWSLLNLLVQRIPERIPIILDGKRNDIGNTAAQYASALYDRFRADWVTVNPYMGYDSMRPFMERKDKGVFVLCLTSNAGARDFQMLEVEGRALYKVVAERVRFWNKDNNCGLVVGATHLDQLREIREIAGDMPLLIPGVGAQGGSLDDSIIAGTDNFLKPAVVNVSRSVLYASNATDFDQRARQEIAKLNAAVTRLRYGDKPAEPKGQPVVSNSQQTVSNNPQSAPNNQKDTGERASGAPPPGVGEDSGNTSPKSGPTEITNQS
ncbi:MAG: orotidine-5'-phosphate decarboxylase [Candidatus Zixiibacteriota bacterium]